MEASEGESLTKDNKSKLNRRDFLKLAAASVSTLFGLKLLPPETVKAPSIIDAIKESIEWDGENIAYQHKGVSVYADTFSGVLTRWNDSLGNGSNFNLERLLETNQRAMQTKKVQLSEVVRVNTSSEIVNNKKVEKLLPDKMPEDILSKEEIREKGVIIVGSENVDLHIRKSAFEKGGLLEYYNGDSNRKLTILITDAATISRRAFRGERYKEYSELLDKVFPHDKDSYNVVKARIDKLQDTSSMGELDYLSIAEIEELKSIDEEELVEKGINSSVRGYYLTQGHETGVTDSAVILLAVGERPEGLDFLRVFTYPKENVFQPELSLLNLNTSLKLPPIEGLSKQQSYISPDDLHELPPEEAKYFTNLPLYLPELKTQGFVLIHEICHDIKLRKPTGDVKFDWNEKETDRIAGEFVKEANDKLTLNGDDSGYSLVFVLKKTNEFVVT
jgi:hypothetical protein